MQSIEGKLIIGLNEKQIKEILPENELNDVSQAISELMIWAIPHWEWVRSVKVGAVNVGLAMVVLLNVTGMPTN